MYLQVNCNLIVYGEISLYGLKSTKSPLYPGLYHKLIVFELARVVVEFSETRSIWDGHG